MRSQLEEPIHDIRNKAIKVARNTFRNAADPEGRPWAPISPATFRLGKPKGSAPLVRTGAMRRGIHGVIIRRARGPELIIQSDQDYAGKHLLGDRLNRLRGNPAPIPARRFMGLGPKHLARIEKDTARWMDKYVDRPNRLRR